MADVLPPDLVCEVLMRLGSPADVRSMVTSCKAFAAHAFNVGTHYAWLIENRGIPAALRVAVRKDDVYTTQRLIHKVPPPERAKFLFLAATHNAVNVAISLVSIVNVNATFTDNDTVLHVAARNGIETLVAALLQAKPPANVNATNSVGRTPLHVAATAPVVRLLVRAPGASVNMYDWWSSNTPLKTFIDARDIQRVDAILAAPGIDVNRMALHCAVRTGDIDIITAILAAPGIDVNVMDNEMQTALHYAAQTGDVNAIKALLAAPGIKVNPFDRFCKTPLMYAANLDDDAPVRALLAAPGINVNWYCLRHNTALHVAAMKGSADVVAALLEVGGINVNAVNSSGATPLHIAAANKTVSALLEAILAASKLV